MSTDEEREVARRVAREEREALEKAWTPPSSLYAEGLKFAEEVEDGYEL